MQQNELWVYLVLLPRCFPCGFSCWPWALVSSWLEELFKPPKWTGFFSPPHSFVFSWFYWAMVRTVYLHLGPEVFLGDYYSSISLVLDWALGFCGCMHTPVHNLLSSTVRDWKVCYYAVVHTTTLHFDLTCLATRAALRCHAQPFQGPFSLARDGNANTLPRLFCPYSPLSLEGSVTLVRDEVVSWT